MLMTLSVSLLAGMVSDDLGRTTGETFRTSFVVFLWLVFCFGVMPYPGCGKIIDEVKTSLVVLLQTWLRGFFKRSNKPTS